MAEHFHRLGWALGFLWLGLVWYFSLAADPIVRTPAIPYFDKVEHALSYAGLMWWFGQLVDKNKSRFLIAVALMAMGVLLEYLQGLGGVRQRELADAIANSVGVGCALWLLRYRVVHILVWMKQTPGSPHE